MLRDPVPGRTKTRLAKGIGSVGAAWWMRHRLRRLHVLQDHRWDLVLAVTPDCAIASRLLPAGTRVPQGRGDLGRRMARLLAGGPAVLIGSDIPGITRAQIAASFRGEVVLGPATDGGYWLIGRQGAHPWRRGILDGVRWSTPHALADTMAALKDRHIVLADRMADVDTPQDLAGQKRMARPLAAW